MVALVQGDKLPSRPIPSIVLQNVELQNVENKKTPNYKTPITKRRKLQKVELQNVQLQNVESYKRWTNKGSKVTKHYKTSNVTKGRKTVQQYMKNSRG
jgi:hypothetical protein